MTLHHRGLDAFLWATEAGSETQPEPTPADKTTLTVETPAGRIEDLPEYAQAIIKDLRKESATRRKALDDAEKAAAVAADAKLAEQNEWKTLAEQRAVRVAELEPLAKQQAEQLAALEELLSKQLDAELKTWPQEVKDLAPADGGILTRLAWVEKSRPLATKLLATPPANGNGPGPKPAGLAGQRVNDDAAKAKFGRYIASQF